MSRTRRRRTTHVRIYQDDLRDVQLRFPNIKMADFFHVSVKTNPLIQMEASLRGQDVQRKKKK